MMTLVELVLHTTIVLGLFIFLIYRPGALLVNRIFPQLPPLDKIIISAIIGMVLFVLLQFYLGHLGWLHTWPIVAGVSLVMILGHSFIKIKKWIPTAVYFWKGIQMHGLLLLIVVIVALLQGSLHFFSGWPTDQGFVLHAFHGSDAPLHLSCIDQLTWRFPPHKPGFSGVVWNNYHYLADLFWAGFKRIYPALNTMHLYFRVAPMLYSILISLTMYSLIRKITGKNSLALGGVIINGLTGGLGYLLPILTNQAYPIWESLFWLSPPFSLFFNPGVVTSYFLILAGSRLLIELPKTNSKGSFIIVALLLGSIIGFKVFGGLLVLGGLLVVALWQVISKQQLEWLILFGLTLIISLSLFLPNNSSGSGLLSFLPGYILITMMASPDRLALLPFNLLKSWLVYKPWLLAGTMMLALPVFIIGNLFGKIKWLIAFIKSWPKWKQASPVMIFIASICLAAFTLPLIIGQFGVNWQPIQFGYYAVLFMTIPSVIQLEKWFKRCSVLQIRIIWVMVMMVGLPCIIHSIVVMRWGYVVSKTEKEAFQFLQDHTPQNSIVMRPLIPKQRHEDGVNQLEQVIAHGEIMSLEDIKDHAKKSPTAKSRFLRPSSLPDYRQPIYELDSAFVAAFSKRNSYLEDITTAQSMGFNYQPRLTLLYRLLSWEHALEMKEWLQTEHINYLMLFGQDQLQVELEPTQLKEVFKNKDVKIVEVSQ